MQILWPDSSGRTGAELSDADLERIYAYPKSLDRPWVHVNFVRSVDGTASVDGRSEALSHPADQRIFALGRDLADVILVGARTVIAETYAGAKANARRAERRRRLGLATVPPIAVVSGRCTIPPDADLLTDTSVPPLIYTCATAPAKRRHALTEAGAEVVDCGDTTVNLRSVLADLDRRGLRRVDCEGGPRLLAGMIAEDLVDQLCLTISPIAAGPDPDRLAAGPIGDLRRLNLASVLHESDYLMLRYTRRP